MQNKDITGVRAEIATLRAFPDKMTWDALATKYGVNKGLLWRIVERGHEPKDTAIRERLGMDVFAAVVPVNGASIPGGSQALKADRCECGRWFIGNHPKRRKCFACSPYRRRHPADNAGNVQPR